MKPDDPGVLNCPLPVSEYATVLLAHGGGGKLMHALVDKVFIPVFDGPGSEEKHDGAVVAVGRERVVLTTDSYVVDPLFFPGGDIGTLAVNGTVNDLAMCGARPLYLGAAFIIEEGFPVETLGRIARSMRRAADRAGVRIVTGDTKVVDRGRGHGVFINTSGVGILEHDLAIGPGRIRPGDSIVISGDIGRHGMAVMAKREGLAFETTIESDCAPLCGHVLRLIDEGIEIHCLRDLTRGGLATALVEIAEASRLQLVINEGEIAVREEVRGACELLGLDPMYVANEGRFVAIVAGRDAQRTAAILSSCSPELDARVVGEVTGNQAGLVTVTSVVGAERVVDMLSGDQLPRIC